jgi:hypothetical protein
MVDDDDLPEPEEHVHGENCNHENDDKKVDLDDLDQEATN